MQSNNNTVQFILQSKEGWPTLQNDGAWIDDNQTKQNEQYLVLSCRFQAAEYFGFSGSKQDKLHLST